MVGIHYNRHSPIFPGVYGKYPIEEMRVNTLNGNNLRIGTVEYEKI
jgi:hypothetical protein